MFSPRSSLKNDLVRCLSCSSESRVFTSSLSIEAPPPFPSLGGRIRFQCPSAHARVPAIALRQANTSCKARERGNEVQWGWSPRRPLHTPDRPDLASVALRQSLHLAYRLPRR